MASAKSALLSLCEAGDWDGARNFLAKGKTIKKDQLNFVSTEGTTSLAYACAEDVLDVAELLLKAGADPMIVDQDGVTCVHIAALTANAVLLKLLFETPAKKPDANKADKTGSTPLHHAVEPDDEGDAKAAAECVAILLSHGANAAAKNGDGQTAAELATLTAVQAALEADGGGGRRGGRAAAGRDGSQPPRARRGRGGAGGL